MAFRSNITRLIDSQGSTEERQLIARWREEVDGFLGTFGADLLAGKYRLAFELSARLELGLTVMPAALSKDPSMAMRASHLLPEPARSVANGPVAANADCQVSQHLLPASCRYSLRIRNRAYSGFNAPSPPGGQRQVPVAGSPYPGATVQSYYGCPPAPFSPEAIHSWLLSDDISFWLSAMHVPLLLERLRETTLRLEARLRVSLVPRVAEALEHYVLHNDQAWTPVRSGLVLRDVPADLAARLLSDFGIRHFRYFAPYRAYRSLALVLDQSDQVERCILIP